MLYDRMQVLLGYVSAVIMSEALLYLVANGGADCLSPAEEAAPDDALLRDISAIVATLPTMQTQDFREEVMTVRKQTIWLRIHFLILFGGLQEHSDVQLTQYLSSLTKSLAELNDVSLTLLAVRSRATDTPRSPSSPTSLPLYRRRVAVTSLMRRKRTAWRAAEAGKGWAGGRSKTSGSRAVAVLSLVGGERKAGQR